MHTPYTRRPCDIYIHAQVILVQNPDVASPGGGVAMATQCSELMGLDPSRSCMLVARFLGDAGQFEDAEELIKMTQVRGLTFACGVLVE